MTRGCAPKEVSVIRFGCIVVAMIGGLEEDMSGPCIRVCGVTISCGVVAEAGGQANSGNNPAFFV